jgi:hypothetical protein
MGARSRVFRKNDQVNYTFQILIMPALDAGIIFDARR